MLDHLPLITSWGIGVYSVFSLAMRQATAMFDILGEQMMLRFCWEHIAVLFLTCKLVWQIHLMSVVIACNAMVVIRIRILCLVEC